MRLAAGPVILMLAAGCVARPPATFNVPDRLDRWARVAAIPPGAEVRVWTRDSATAAHGRFVRADDEEMVLETGAGTTGVFLRALTTRVSVVTGRPYRRYLGNGLRTGLLAGGVALGLIAAGGGLDDAPEAAVAAPFVGVFYGILMGAIGAAATPDTTPVFVAPDAGATPAARGPGRLPQHPATVFEAPDTGEPCASAARHR